MNETTLPDSIERRAAHVQSDDGWRVRVDISAPAAGHEALSDRPAALLVPATKHERDGYGPTLIGALVDHGFTVMASDVRGRGDSCEPFALHTFPPGHLHAMRSDVAAALHALAAQPGVAAGKLVVMAEQDTGDAVAAAALDDRRVAALVLISARLGPDTLQALAHRRIPVCGLVAKEDAPGLGAVVDAYGRSNDPRSRLRVVGGVGYGTTMFSAWQFLRPSEPPLEHWLAAWCAWVVSDEPAPAEREVEQGRPQ